MEVLCHVIINSLIYKPSFLIITSYLYVCVFVYFTILFFYLQWKLCPHQHGSVSRATVAPSLSPPSKTVCNVLFLLPRKKNKYLVSKWANTAACAKTDGIFVPKCWIAHLATATWLLLTLHGHCRMSCHPLWCNQPFGYHSGRDKNSDFTLTINPQVPRV